FIYSARPGTPAAVLTDNTTDLIKKHRLGILQSVITENANAVNKKMVGTIESVLVDGVSRKSETQVTGRTENNRKVNFNGGSELIGQFVDVKITEARTNSLQGDYVGLTVLKGSTVNSAANSTEKSTSNLDLVVETNNQSQRKLA
ncbi:MAG: TRAM domain-containing protein, partial [Proteobacteria bacterium]|nr:TRAM domain-containing protein [Pseudomonadota bacterium]